MCAGVARAMEKLDKYILTPVADRLALKQYSKEVKARVARKRRELWKAQTIRVATTFHNEDIYGENPRYMNTIGFLN